MCVFLIRPKQIATFPMKNYNNNDKPWKSSKIFRVKPKTLVTSEDVLVIVIVNVVAVAVAVAVVSVVVVVGCGLWVVLVVGML